MRWTLNTARMFHDRSWPGIPLEGEPSFTKFRRIAEMHTPWHSVVTQAYFGDDFPLRVDNRQPLPDDIAIKLEEALNNLPPFDTADRLLNRLDRIVLDHIGFHSAHLACLPRISLKLRRGSLLLDIVINDSIDVAVRFLDSYGKTGAIWKSHCLSVPLNPTETVISGMMGKDLGSLIGTSPTGLCVSAARHDGRRLHLNFHTSNKG